MNYTENYQLPQWEENDRVLREDFNTAMTKVDEGLRRVPCVELLSIVLAEETQELQLNVADIDFFEYSTILLFVRNSGDVPLIHIRTNGITTSTYHINEEYGNFDIIRYTTSVLMNWSLENGERLSFYPPRRGCQVAASCDVAYCDQDYFRTTMRTGISPVLWENLKTLDLEASSNLFPVGTIFRLLAI